MAVEELEVYEAQLLLGTVELDSHKDYKLKVILALGKVYAKVFDETGRYPLQNVSYEAEGPYDTTLEGTTDENGLLQHRDIPAGLYDFTFAGEYEVVLPTYPSYMSEVHYQNIEGYQVEEEFEEPEIEEKETVYDFPLIGEE